MWTKSSFSSSNNACVEVAADGDEILVRDSKHPDGGTLRFSRLEIDAFLRGAKNGEFDRFS